RAHVRLHRPRLRHGRWFARLRGAVARHRGGRAALAVAGVGRFRGEVTRRAAAAGALSGADGQAHAVSGEGRYGRLNSSSTLRCQSLKLLSEAMTMRVSPDGVT